jgi:hypothetical protein
VYSQPSIYLPIRQGIMRIWILLVWIVDIRCNIGKLASRSHQYQSSEQQQQQQQARYRYVKGKDAIQQQKASFQLKDVVPDQLRIPSDVSQSQRSLDHTRSTLSAKQSSSSMRMMEVAPQQEGFGSREIPETSDKASDITFGPTSRHSQEIVRRYRDTALQLSYETFASSINSTISGSITTYEFQKDLLCSAAPTNIVGVVLGHCFGIYDDADFYDSQATYAIMTMNALPQPSDQTITVNVIYYQDNICTEPYGLVDVLYLPRNCSLLPINDTVIRAAAYYEYANILIYTFPSHGVMKT